MLSAKKMARLILGERQECLALSLCCVEISTVAGQPGCYLLYAEPCFKYTIFSPMRAAWVWNDG